MTNIWDSCTKAHNQSIKDDFAYLDEVLTVRHKATESLISLVNDIDILPVLAPNLWRRGVFNSHHISCSTPRWMLWYRPWLALILSQPVLETVCQTWLDLS